MEGHSNAAQRRSVLHFHHAVCHAYITFEGEHHSCAGSSACRPAAFPSDGPLEGVQLRAATAAAAAAAAAAATAGSSLDPAWILHNCDCPAIWHSPAPSFCCWALGAGV
mmetsp:Transcript_78290/g.181656  ORF Transcript_78290/g.181656 Transcript_78290/m.181656 type:complete len:109 (-) Transcript_78290:96-422(-)